MRIAKRIGLSVLDDELKSLIETSSKIIPVEYVYVQNNTNVDFHEYVRIITNNEYLNNVYVWDLLSSTWKLIGADDKVINWSDLSNKPVSYPPSHHTHDYSISTHLHDDRYYLESEIDVMLLGKSNTTHNHDASYSSITHNHDVLYSPLIHNHNALYSLLSHNHDISYYTELEVDALLNQRSLLTHHHDANYSLISHNHNTLYSLLTHDHDGRYYTESEVNTLLGQRSLLSHHHDANYSNITHNHDILYSLLTHNHDSIYAVKSVELTVSDLNTRMFNIENGYTEGHSHANLLILNGVTDVKITEWNNKANTVHLHDDRYYTEVETDTLLNQRSLLSHHHDASYSLLTHNHNTLYSLLAHHHDANYSLISHNHNTLYSLLTHHHDANYSLTTHHHNALYSLLTHDHDGRYYTESEVNTLLNQRSLLSHHHDASYSLLTHNHNTLYSLLAHHHDANYSLISHNHNTLYSLLTHHHDANYSLTTHHHNALYSLLAHNHDANYYTESEVNTLLSSKAESTTLNGHIGNTTIHVTQTDKDLNTISYTHSQSAHSPSNAQRNSDITKAEIEARLTGEIISHTHNYSLTTHNHNTLYSLLTHDHDANYSPSIHTHDEYVKLEIGTVQPVNADIWYKVIA